MSRALNSIPVKPGSARAVCNICGCKSQPAPVDDNGEPDLFSMARGWSQAPFPANFQQRDGSIGSTYTCPSCNAKFKRGLALNTRAYLRGVPVVASQAMGAAA